MLIDRSTLNEFLIQESVSAPGAGGELCALVLNVAVACKAIARRVAYGALGYVLPDRVSGVGGGEPPRMLPAVATELFRRCNEWTGQLAGMVSEEMEAPFAIPAVHPKGDFLLVFDPLDGSPDQDVDLPVGSIFSILRAPKPGRDASVEDFLQPGVRQVCAGYAIYGPSTMLVVTVGTGVHGFTLDPQLGEFILTHPSIQIPRTTSEFAIDASNSRFWEPAVKRYVDECLAGKSGPRGRDFDMRWIASLVAETHRILMRGGVFLYPRDRREPSRRGRLRLLYECNPVAYLIEQAGGAASTGHERVLDVAPEGLQHRSGFIFGTREEVERIVEYHHDHNWGEYDAPLFGSRGLFRSPA